MIAIERRRENRTKKRRAARQEHRLRGRAKQTQNRDNETVTPAKAQEPKTRKERQQLTLCQKRHIATLDIRGAKKVGLREEVERWMKLGWRDQP